MLTHRDVLQKTIQQLLTPGKGILAADESPANIGPKFAAINLESTPETRRQYREYLFETKGCEEYLSGVILHEETFGQKIHGKPCPEYLLDKGIPCAIYYPIPLHSQKAYSDPRYKEEDFPVTNRLVEEVLSLPMHTELDDVQIKFITDSVLEYLN